MNEDPQLYRPAEVAALLSLTKTRIYQLIRCGEIPATRVGGAIRVPREAWQEWLHMHCKRALHAARVPRQGRG